VRDRAVTQRPWRPRWNLDYEKEDRPREVDFEEDPEVRLRRGHEMGLFPREGDG
jgi:hypothetical protein